MKGTAWWEWKWNSIEKKNVINKLNSTTELNTEYSSKENKPNRRNKIKKYRAKNTKLKFIR